MNNKAYAKKVKEIINSRKCDIDFLKYWYEKEKEILSQLAKQKSKISHPRHRGDLRENDFKSIINCVIPEAFKVSKGYAVNHYGAMSSELDCLIYAKDKTFTLVKKDDLEYIPIHSVLSTIEIKSNYNLEEIRKFKQRSF